MMFFVYCSEVPLACSSKLHHITLENQKSPSHTVRFSTMMACISIAVFNVNDFSHCCDHIPEVNQLQRRGGLFWFTVQGVKRHQVGEFPVTGEAHSHGWNMLTSGLIREQ